MTITYQSVGAAVDYSPFPAAKIRRASKSWLRRLFVAIAEARMREARRDLARHRHLLPPELEISGDKLIARNEDELPFAR